MKDDLATLADIFKALASETRLKIVMGLIRKNECNVGFMAEKLGLAQPNVSQHLTVLKNAGIIEGYKKGAQTCYKITSKLVAAIIKSICRQSAANAAKGDSLIKDENTFL